MKNEEKQLLEQLINYKENEKLCNDIRDIREEIKKYKIIIEKSTNACEEYSLEIQKIKNIIGGDDSEGNKGEDENKYNVKEGYGKYYYENGNRYEGQYINIIKSYF